MVTPEIGLEIERDFDLPRAIVWDALIDADLVAGWLAKARIEPRVGGRYDLTWLHTAAAGTITELHEPESLTVRTDTHGVISFLLDELPGGSRGTSTRLRVVIRLAVEAAFAARVRADWMTNLDQLAGLLRGHPVDWANWDRDHGSDWTGYLARFTVAKG